MEPFLIREQQIHTLHQFSQALASVFASATPEMKKALGEALFAECIQCGMSVNGLELIEVSSNTNTGANKLTRLKLGDCARKNCDSRTYRIKFYKHIDLPWEEVLPQIDAKITEENTEAEQSSGVVEEGRRAEQFRFGRKVAIAVVVLLVAFIIRQLYLGGTIPVLREPAKFNVPVVTNQEPQEIDY